MRTKELILRALGANENFISHEGELYKLYDSFTVRGQEIDQRAGFFGTKKVTSDTLFQVDFYLGRTLVHTQKVGMSVLFGQGDTLNIGGVAGTIKTDIETC